MPASDEIQQMKAKDLFEVAPLLTGRTQIDAGLGYNADDFEVDANNIVNLKNKTSYWCCTGLNFQGGENEGHADVDYYVDGTGKAALNGPVATIAMVNLPHGAIITGCIVYGSESDETWTLSRADISAGTSTDLATANVNSENTTITNATVDNENYGYSLYTSPMSIADEIYGARITYTTDYD